MSDMGCSDRHSIDIGYGKQFIRADAALIDQQGAHLAVPVLFDDKDVFMPVNKRCHLILKREPPEP